MIWTLLVFGVCLFMLWKLAFPRIARGARQAPEGDRGVDRRGRAHARRGRRAARGVPRAADRGPRSRPTRSSPARARPARQHEARRRRGGQAPARGAARADPPRHRGRDPPRDPGDPRRGRRPHVLATEKVTRKSLDRRRPAPPRRGGRSPSSTSPPWRASDRELGDGGDRPRLRAARCSRSPRSSDKLDEVREQLGQFADALDDNRELQIFFFSPYFSTRGEEGRAATGRSTAPTPIFLNFLELLVENHRMPALFRIRREYDELWEEANKLLPVEVTSAVELDDETVERIGDAHRRADRPQGRAVHAPSTPTSSAASSSASATRSSTPPSATASTTSQAGRPGQQRRSPKEPRTNAMQIKPDEITSILKSRIEGLDAGQADLTEVGTVLSVADGIARVHGLENCMSFEMLELPHDVTGLALNLESDNVGAVLFGDWEQHRRGRHGQAHRPPARDPGRRRAARPHRRPARPPARRQGRHQHRARPARPSSRRPASSSASR